MSFLEKCSLLKYKLYKKITFVRLYKYIFNCLFLIFMFYITEESK
jgi:hypothetical protein